MDEDDVKAARAALENDQIGSRLLTADRALRLMEAGELHALRRFVFSARFEVRAIEDVEVFEAGASTSEGLQRMVDASGLGARIHTELVDGRPRIVLFSNSKPSSEMAELYSRALATVGALTYSALGLDMSAVLKLPPRDA